MKRFIVPLLLLAATPCWAGTRDLKEDTAVTIVVGPFVDDTGAATTPTVASIDCNLYKNDGTKVDITLAASGTDNDAASVADGYHSLELTTTDTNTPGYLRITFEISGSLIFHEDFNILPANIYDSKYSTDKLQVDMTQIEGSDATDTLLTLQEIIDGILNEAISGHSTAGTVGKALIDTLADTNELQGDWANGGRLDLILDTTLKYNVEYFDTTANGDIGRTFNTVDPTSGSDPTVTP